MKTLCTVHLLVFLNSQAAPAAMEDRTIGETQEPYDATADSGTLIPRRLKNEYMGHLHSVGRTSLAKPTPVACTSVPASAPDPASTIVTRW